MFTTILYPNQAWHEKPRQSQPPACLKDLNLDQILLPIHDGKPNDALASVCYTPPQDPEVIRYRQDILRDLEQPALRMPIGWFAEALWPLNEGLTKLREALTSKTTYDNDDITRGSLMHCAVGYAMFVEGLAAGLKAASPQSAGMRAFADYVAQYVTSPAFLAMKRRIDALKATLQQVRYCMYIKGYTLRVRKYEDQPIQAESLQQLLARFEEGDMTGYKRFIAEVPVCRETEVSVLRQVAAMFPEAFKELNAFCLEHVRFVDETLLRFSLEVRFYLNWLNYTDSIREAGLPLCFPTLSDDPAALFADGVYDLALAKSKGDKTVTNDFRLSGKERILVVTGPNQGGKTTFARSVGQAHYLAALGLSVPGRAATLLRFDRILTHFEKEEDLNDLSGKLLDDLKRLKAILDVGTSRSLFIINEIYSSTTLADATALGGRMLDAIVALGAPAVVVTFLDELTAHGPETVSMVSDTSEEDPGRRTYKVLRRPSDGLAYAMHLAANHGLTYEQILRRLRP